MGKFIDNFKSISKNAGNTAVKIADNMANKEKTFDNGHIKSKSSQTIGDGIYDGYGDEFGLGPKGFKDDFYNDDGMMNYGKYDIGIQPAQKPESFHHFILENQYKDLERSIRGFKDIFNKETQKWETIRKKSHCFTDEEAEEILRTAQSHLATDIKLSFINKEVFGEMMMAIFKRLDELFYAIAEYRYGRYGENESQYDMKLQNRKIFLELWTRVQANYSRAIQGTENKATHGSVQGQESLQQTDRMNDRGRRYM